MDTGSGQAHPDLLGLSLLPLFTAQQPPSLPLRLGVCAQLGSSFEELVVNTAGKRATRVITHHLPMPSWHGPTAGGPPHLQLLSLLLQQSGIS